MIKLFEHNGTFSSRDGMKGLPFYGQKGDFNFTSGRSQFTPGISIKMVPLKDLSVDADLGYTDFDLAVNKVENFFHMGNRARGTLMNSKIGKKQGKTIVGKIHKIDIDRKNNTIRIFLINPKDLEISEIYTDTVERMFENRHCLPFEDFKLVYS